MEIKNITFAWLVLLFATLSLSACSSNTATGDPDDDGGIIGTGVVLRGTVALPVTPQGTVVAVKSMDAQLTELALNAEREFSTTTLRGMSPWLLRVTTPGGLSLYGIAYTDGTRNINSFSDLSLRNWFAKQSLQIDEEFESSAPFSSLPAQQEIDDTSSSLFELIEPVLESYDVSGEEIISGDYEANDEGVDAFLDANQAIIENGLVNFVITEPDTQTQSITQSLLMVVSDFTDQESEPPSQPSRVRAIGIAVDEIVVLWEPSVDDVAVAGYQIIRNENLIATTPYPVFTDSGLSVNQTYAYEVVAFDAGGNFSTASAPEISSVLLTENLAPPLPPTLLTLLSSTSSKVQFFWAQEGIDNVVSFRVYRSVHSQPARELMLVSGSLATDTAVVEGGSYCYQVAALNASGKESELSEELCVISSNAGLNGDDSPTPEWVVPDIEALECESRLLNSELIRGTNDIEPGCYVVPETLSVSAGATLRLTAGTVLKFLEGSALVVESEGTLVVDGNPQNPVVLTGEFNIRGHWGGINFQNSMSTGNLIRGAVIQYAGGEITTRAAIAITQGKSRFRVENSLIRFNKNYGFGFNFDLSVIDGFSGNRIIENDITGFVSADLIKALDGSSEFIGNDKDQIDIPRNSYRIPITIPNLGVPLRWNGVFLSNASLTIEPGVEVTMLDSAVLDVEGAVSVEGTLEQPITLTGSLRNQGHWDGFLLSGSGDKVFDHVTISYAGNNQATGGAIKLVCAPVTSTLSVDNATLTDSASWAIFVEGEGCNTVIGESMLYLNNALGNVSTP